MPQKDKVLRGVRHLSELHPKPRKKLAGEAGVLARYLGLWRPKPARPSRSGLSSESIDAICSVRWTAKPDEFVTVRS